MEFEQDMINHMEESIDYVELVNKLTYNQLKDLNELVGEITTWLKQPEYNLSIDMLEIYYLKLTTELYIIADTLKDFEIYSSLAKSKSSEMYNHAYLSESMLIKDKKPTIVELQLKAESKSKKESTINILYSSAFKDIKNKIEAGNNIADALKNIIKSKNTLDFISNQTTKYNETRVM